MACERAGTGPQRQASSVHRRVLVQAVGLTIEVVGFLLEAVSVPQESLEYVEDSKRVFKLCDGACTIGLVQAVRVLAEVIRVF
jgi:hypothetical protein